MAGILETITISFPVSERLFPSQLLDLLEPLGRREENQLKVSPSNPLILPRIKLRFQGGGAEIQAQFELSDGQMFPVDVVNLTGVEKQHPKSYQFLRLETITRKLKHAGIGLTRIDHVGINLPWFGVETHPLIYALRGRLSASCLYHRYPSGELWDFILRGDAEEITRQKTVDYSTCRKPKFELVCFSFASTPLIQLDIETSGSYGSLHTIFPEALADPEFKNVWIYTQNPYLQDVCLILNEGSDQDWSVLFRGHRL